MRFLWDPISGDEYSGFREAPQDPSARHPYWDLLDAADLVPDLSGDRKIALLEDYVGSVLAELR